MVGPMIFAGAVQAVASSIRDGAPVEFIGLKGTTVMAPEVKDVPTLREISDRSWMEQGPCREVDTERWFLAHPPKRVRRHIAAVCSSCPVTELCLSYALVNHEEFGAWGGHLVSDLESLRQRLAAGQTLSSVLKLGTRQAGSRPDSDAA